MPVYDNLPETEQQFNNLRKLRIYQRRKKVGENKQRGINEGKQTKKRIGENLKKFTNLFFYRKSFLNTTNQPNNHQSNKKNIRIITDYRFTDGKIIIIHDD